MIDKIRNWALLAPAFIPLVYVDLFFYPLVAPKAFFFRIALTVAIIATTYLLIKGRGLYLERLKSVWAWIPLGLLIVAYTTSAVGVDFYHSFWSVFDRSAGLLALTYGVAYTYLLLLTATKDFMWKFITLVSGVASIVAGYAILQWLGGVSNISIPGILDTKGRIGSTIGNAAFLAGYLGLTLFLTLIVAKRREKRADLWYVGAILQGIAIILTATRGTILALIAVFGIALVYTAIAGKGKLQKFAIGGLVLSLIAGSLFMAFRENLQTFPFEPVARIANIGVEDATTSSRLFVWENTLTHGLEKPFTGYGAEHIDFVFDKFYSAQYITEQWFDRSHNLYLDFFIQYGVFGLLLFLLFIAGLCRFALRMRKEDVFVGNMLLLLLGTYILQSIFVFDTLNTLSVLYPLFAFGFIQTNESMRSGIISKSAFGIIAIISIVGLYFAVLQPAYANLKLGASYIQHVEDVDAYVQHFTAGLATNSFVDLEFGYQAYALYTDRQQYVFSGEDKAKAYTVAYNTLLQNTKKYPYDARTFVYLGHVMEARPSGVEYSEEENIKVLRDSLLLSPTREQAYYMLANIYIAKGNNVFGEEREKFYQMAIDSVEEYRARAPKIAEPYFVLAELYRVTGKREKAIELFEQGIVLYAGDAKDARRIAGYLLSQNKTQEARPYLETVYRANPTDYVAIFDLAKLRFLDGDIQGAVELVELVELKSPDVLGTDPIFIQSLLEAIQ